MSRSLHPTHQNLKVYVGVQSYIQFRWSQQHISSQSYILGAAAITATGGCVYFARTGKGVRSLQVLRSSFQVTRSLSFDDLLVPHPQIWCVCPGILHLWVHIQSTYMTTFAQGHIVLIKLLLWASVSCSVKKLIRAPPSEVVVRNKWIRQ